MEVHGLAYFALTADIFAYSVREPATWLLGRKEDRKKHKEDTIRETERKGDGDNSNRN